jgi:hypothetical protein
LEREIEQQRPAARDRAFDLFDRVAGLWSAAPMAGQPGLG